MMNKNTKSILALTMAALLLTVAVSGTLAYLVDVTSQVKNTFTPARVTCAVNEPGWTDGNKTKSNVSITNTGTTSAYIRAMIVGNWYDANGNIVAPHTVEIGNPTGWKKDGEYDYHVNPVAAGQDTSVLIASYTPVRPEGVPADAVFKMTIVCQAVQSEPKTAVTQAWGSDAAALLN
ncbi:MAG: hypothetical protein IKU34_04500 [Clostridia bacterium]|nr:hypothetical protein [Clostridia bacterium]